MIVHFLMHGRTLCNMPGTPDSWPKGHIWTGDPALAAKTVTCPDCLAERTRRVTAAANKSKRT